MPIYRLENLQLLNLLIYWSSLYNRTSHCLCRAEIGVALIFVPSLIFYHRKLYRTLQFAKFFLRARLRPLTPATAMPLNCWKMLQKHSFLSKFSGVSAPDPRKSSVSRLLENASKALIFSKFSGGSAPDRRKGSVSRLLDNASKALIYFKIFRGLCPRPRKGSVSRLLECVKNTHFCRNFPGAQTPTHTRALPLDCWKMLQKH